MRNENKKQLLFFKTTPKTFVHNNYNCSKRCFDDRRFHNFKFNEIALVHYVSEKPWNVEGKNNKEWVLMDYVSVVAHVFYKETREFYDLEDLWADAKRIDIPDLN